MEDNGIAHHKSSPYRPQANGQVEADNKSIKKILSKMVVTYKNWAAKLRYALFGHRTTYKTATGMTPFNLVYGAEAVLPLEVNKESLRVILETKVPEVQWAQTRYDQLALLDEKRLRARYHLQLQYIKMA